MFLLYVLLKLFIISKMIKFVHKYGKPYEIIRISSYFKLKKYKFIPKGRVWKNSQTDKGKTYVNIFLQLLIVLENLVSFIGGSSTADIPSDSYSISNENEF